MVVAPGQTAPGLSLLPKDLLSDIDDNKFTGPGLYQMVYGLDQFIIEPFARDRPFMFWGPATWGISWDRWPI